VDELFEVKSRAVAMAELDFRTALLSLLGKPDELADE
jgi:hypothetical protein